MIVPAIATVLLVIGVRESARVNNVIVVIKVAIVVLFIAACAWFVNTANWVTPQNPDGAFIPPSLGPGQFGWSGVIRGAAVVFFAYIGFDAVSTAAQEAQEPATRHANRDHGIARGLLGSVRAGRHRHRRHRAL